MRNSKTLQFAVCAAIGWMCGSAGNYCMAQTPTGPLTAYAIFYNGVLEFSTCGTITIDGPVHCNTNIDVGAGTGATLTFNAVVTACGTISAPTNNGQSWTDPTNYNTGWRTIFNSNYVEDSPILATPIFPAINLIEIPVTNNAGTLDGNPLLYNEAQVILIVSNRPSTTNTMVYLQVQAAPSSADVPGQDPSPLTFTLTNPTPAILSTDLPFLSLTNHFYDGRENSTNNVTQIDVGKYTQWLTNSANAIADEYLIPKYPASGVNGYPTILFVADNRVTNSSYKEDVVRLTNGIAPPSNGGEGEGFSEGFSVATPNPLYVMGNYNQTNPAYLGTTNTSSGTVPCALYSDALTILSTNWNDSNSLHSSFSSSSTEWNASSDTVNAAIVTGIVPSTGNTDTTFSGGVHNLPRLLEDWSGSVLTLHTSIINLFNSAKAKGQFVDPGTYYEPPTRQYSYDQNFSNPIKAPPGMVVQTCPVITVIPATLPAATAGTAYSQTIAADGGSEIYTFEVSGGNLPPGLTFSTLFRFFNTNGFLAGTPTNSGNYNFTITATDFYGCTASQDYTVEVFGGPVVTVEPRSQSVSVGGSLNLTVSATGDPAPTYQWYFNSAAISGAVSNSLEIDNFQATNEGDYYVVISNEFESVTSAPAQLYVSEPLRLANPYVDSNGSFWVSVVGPAGTNFVVDGSTDLLNWTSLATNTAPYGVVPFTDTNESGAPQRFYRAWLSP